MPDLTFITPVAPYHLDLIDRVQATVAQQTIPCRHIIVVDHKGKGPGFARNYGLKHVDTPYVSFLDADDELLPDFAQKALAHHQPGTFVYCDWFDGDTPTRAPRCPWSEGTRNIITTVLATADARRFAFDETLDGLEDTDYYLRLIYSGVCGRHLPVPLFRYGAGGERSKAFLGSAPYHAAMRRIMAQFGGKTMACAGCGNDLPAELPPGGDKQVNDELAQAIWGGNMQKRGPVTGRLYPRSGNGKLMWVDPADIDKAPHLWRRVEPEPQPVYAPVPQANGHANGDERRVLILEPDAPAPVQEPPARTVQELGQRVMPAIMGFPLAPPRPVPVDPAPVAPDARKALDLYKRALDVPALAPVEIEALKQGHEVVISEDETRIRRKLAPDTVTQKRKPAAKPKRKASASRAARR